MSLERNFSVFFPANSPLTKQFYEQNHQTFSPAPSSSFQQHQNEQHFLQLSIGTSFVDLEIPPLFSYLLCLETNKASTPSPSHSQAPSSSLLKPDEQQLLNAIHAHPNKRDLVLNLLRQMNESTLPNPPQ